MSSYHVLEGSKEKHEIRVVFHIPIPDINNAVGVNYRTILTKAEPFITSLVPYLATYFAAEVTALQAGSIYEYTEVISYCATFTDVQKLAVVTARYIALAIEIQTRLQNQYVYWGKNQDVS